MRADVLVDAGGVVALRLLTRGDALAAEIVRVNWFAPLVEGAASLLGMLDAYGRAAIGLEIRGAAGLYVALDAQRNSELKPEDLIDGDILQVGGEIALPADEADVREVNDRWTRELARAAHLPAWEPWIELPAEDAPSDESPS